MRSIPFHLAISFALAAGCTSSSESVSGEGQFTIPWVLHGPAGYVLTSCDELAVDHIVATLTSAETGDVIATTAPCAAGTLLTDPSPLGQYAIELHAFDEFGKQIDTMAADTSGWILKEGDRVVLPPQLITVRMPDEDLHFDWHAPANCGGDRVQVTLDFGTYPTMTMDWPCGQSDPTWSMPIPTSGFHVWADVWSPSNQHVASSQLVLVSGRAGHVDVDFDIQWP